MKWEKTRCPAARRTTCEIQLPKGWEAKPKPTGPSDHHLRAPGPLAPNPANKHTLPPNTGPRPGSKVHISSASWQALRQYQAPHWALGKEKSFRLVSLSPVGAHSTSWLYIQKTGLPEPLTFLLWVVIASSEMKGAPVLGQGAGLKI